MLAIIQSSEVVKLKRPPRKRGKKKSQLIEAAAQNKADLKTDSK